MVTMEIDGAAFRNREVVPHPEDSECIECFRVPRRELAAFIREQEAQNVGVDTKLYVLCAGARVSAQMKNFGNILFRRLHSRNRPVIVRAERDGGSASAKFNILNQGRVCENGYWNRPGQCGTCDDPHRD